MIQKQSFVLSDGLEKLKDNLIDSIAHPVFIKDKDHKWVMFNNAFTKIIQASKEDLIGKSDYEFFSKEESDVFWEKDNDVLKTGKTNINKEELTDKDGEKHTILTSKVRIEDEEGNYYILGTITDVSEMKSDEIQLEKKNLQIHAQKNEIKNAVSELHKNTEQNLQIISELIELLSKKMTASTSISSLKHISNWVDSLMLIHNSFGNSFNVNRTSLLEYIDRISESIPDIHDKVLLLISGDPIVISLRYLTPIGLMITELLKAGMIDGKQNSMRFDLRYHSDTLEIEFKSDFPLINDNSMDRDEFGLYHLLQVLTDHLNGEIKRTPDPTRLRILVKDIVEIKRGA